MNMNMKTFFVALTAVVSTMAVSVQNVPASQFVADPTKIKCSTSNNRVANALASGNYAALPQASAAANQGGCGSAVFYLNDKDKTVSYTAFLVDFTDDNVLKLGPNAYPQSSPDGDTFVADYTVSPSSG